MNPIFESYFTRYNSLRPFLQDKPDDLLFICVVIPSYNEPNLSSTLISLKTCYKPSCFTEVIVVINSHENSPEEVFVQNENNKKNIEEFAYKNNDNKISFRYISIDNIEKSNAGVGFARKCGMDEALRRFNAINTDGVIVSLDSDTIVAENYLEKIYECFSNNDIAVANIFFEHNIKLCQNSREVNAIISYELHLRYYRAALKYIGFPYFYHTMGSAFAVRASAYALQGGMNKRKAGEDFYFLHKLFSLNKTIEITETCVYPSPRMSDRVPFGTGASMRQLACLTDENSFKTYSLDAFFDLKNLFSKISLLYRINQAQFLKEINFIDSPLKEFLQLNDIEGAVAEINRNSSNIDSFNKRFFNFFNGFRIMKYLNYSHNEHYCRCKVETQAEKLALLLSSEHKTFDNRNTLLEFYKGFEKGLV